MSARPLTVRLVEEPPRVRSILRSGWDPHREAVVPERDEIIHMTFPRQLFMLCDHTPLSIKAYSLRAPLTSPDQTLYRHPLMHPEHRMTHISPDNLVCLDAEAQGYISDGGDALDVFWNSGWHILPLTVAPGATLLPGEMLQNFASEIMRFSAWHSVVVSGTALDGCVLTRNEGNSITVDMP